LILFWILFNVFVVAMLVLGLVAVVSLLRLKRDI
jgi:hypothetical protein